MSNQPLPKLPEVSTSGFYTLTLQNVALEKIKEATFNGKHTVYASLFFKTACGKRIHKAIYSDSLPMLVGKFSKQFVPKTSINSVEDYFNMARKAIGCTLTLWVEVTRKPEDKISNPDFAHSFKFEYKKELPPELKSLNETVDKAQSQQPPKPFDGVNDPF